MDSISQFFHTLGSPEGLQNLIAQGGLLVLALIIFSETGLLIGFFLPGDSLLITAGVLIGSHKVDIGFVPLALVLSLAAVVGDATGYFIGRKSGERLYNRPDSRLFKREHLIKTHNFYEKHGGKTIIFARFIPIIRTFAPVVAGAAQMGYRKFATYNIIGGVLWILSTLVVGMLLGQTVKNIGDYLYLIIGVVIVLSILPPIIEWLRNRARVRAAAAEQQPR